MGQAKSLCNATMEAQPSGGVSATRLGSLCFLGGRSCSREKKVTSLFLDLAESMFARIFLGKSLVCVSTLNAELQSIILGENSNGCFTENHATATLGQTLQFESSSAEWMGGHTNNNSNISIFFGFLKPIRRSQ